MVQELNFPAGGIYTIKVIKQRDFAVLEYWVQTKFSKSLVLSYISKQKFPWNEEMFKRWWHCSLVVCPDNLKEIWYSSQV